MSEEIIMGTFPLSDLQELVQIRTKYNRLITKVAKMRLYQRQYYAHHCSTDLQAAKKLEREVDTIIKAEHQPQQPQQNLFDTSQLHGA